MSDLQIPSAWKRIELGAGRFTPGVYRTGDVVLPAIPRASGLSLELSGLMPNRNHNGDLLAAIERMPRCLSGERPVIGVLAADPFLRVDQLGDRLAEKGYRDLGNLPSVSQYGVDFKPILDDLDVGTTREFKVLRDFADRGFAISATVADLEDIPPALDLNPRQLFVVPSFDLWRHGKLDPDRLLAFCAQVAERCQRLAARTPLILFAGRMPISPTQARDAGADAVLLD